MTNHDNSYFNNLPNKSILLMFINFNIKKLNTQQLQGSYKLQDLIDLMPQTNIKFSYSFLDKFSIQNKIPNSNDVVLRSRDSGELILMKEIQVTPQQYEETLATLDYQKKLSHQQLLALVDYYPQPSLHKFIVLYEYCRISLRDQFDDRMAEGRNFAETQLWSIFTSLAFGLAYLQQQNVGHGSIYLSDCYLNEQGFIKISDPTCATSNPYSIQTGYFYSPQILRCLIQQTGQQINIFKSDAFSLGCCMLQLTLMKDVSLIFDYESGQINRSALRLMLDDLSDFGLSKQYIRFLRELLEFHDETRLDFVQLKKEIFGLMMADGDQSQEKMRHSYGIKSSISSLCRSKGEPNHQQTFENQQLKQLINEANLLLEFQQKQPKNMRKVALKQIFPENQRNNLLQLPIMCQKPNVDHLFGNLKQSITLGKSRPVSNNNNTASLQQNVQQNRKQTRKLCYLNEEEKDKQNRNETKNGESKKKVLQQIADIQENIERIQFNIDKKRRVRESEVDWKRQFLTSNQSCDSFGESQIINKAKIIKKQLDLLFKQSPEKSRNTAPSQPTYNSQISSNSHITVNLPQPNKQITHMSHMLFSFHPETSTQFNQNTESKTQYRASQNINRSQYRASQNVYTDPQFLRMMQADVEQIMNKRKYGYV